VTFEGGGKKRIKPEIALLREGFLQRLSLFANLGREKKRKLQQVQLGLDIMGKAGRLS